MSPVATVTAASRGIGPATASGSEAVRDIDRAFRIIFAFTGSTVLTCGHTLQRCPSRNRVPWWSPAN
jgi:hypothetical protein